MAENRMLYTPAVLITGSTSGIGLSIAETFASEGYQVAFNGLEENGAGIAAGIAERYKINHLFSNANMMDPPALVSLVKQCEAQFGRLDVLINNAGIQHVSPVQNFPAEQWDAVIAVNLTAPFHLIKAAWPIMMRQKFGRIINIASVHGLVASEYKSAYVSSKHGLLGLTKTIALEGPPHNITCNAICPGYVKTPLVEKQIPDQMRAHNLSEEEVVARVMLAKQSVKAFVSPDLVARMALFLASAEAGTLTGAALPIDGGWSAQ